MEGALLFPRGTIYNIFCKAGDQALRIQANSSADYKGSRVSAAAFNAQDDAQLFMIEKVGLEADDYEIVNCVSDYVFDEESKEIRLGFGKQNSDQKFALVPAPVQGFHKYYWIKTSVKGDKALYLQGILRYGNFDPNNENQLFRFEIAKNNNTLRATSVIINRQSGKALDIPEGSFKKEERIIQWERSRRFNQRWRFVKCGQGVAIQSLLSGFFLDISGESRDEGAKVIVWEQTGNPNQQWAFEQAGNGVYKIRSIHQKTLYLSIKSSSVEDGAKLQCTKKDDPSIYWIIEGQQP